MICGPDRARLITVYCMHRKNGTTVECVILEVKYFERLNSSIYWLLNVPFRTLDSPY